eukprot:scaffold67307_cov48-Phaeocystis_antarctica.AAC.1
MGARVGARLQPCEGGAVAEAAQNRPRASRGRQRHLGRASVVEEELVRRLPPHDEERGIGRLRTRHDVRQLVQVVAVRGEWRHLARRPRRGQRDVVRTALQHDDGVVGRSEGGRPVGHRPPLHDVAQADARWGAEDSREEDLR